MPPKPVKDISNYDPNAYCEFHIGAPGHSTENCIALKHHVQDLRNMRLFHFKDNQNPVEPNVTNNPFPSHNATVGMIDVGDCKILDVSEIPFTMAEVYDLLLE